MVSAWPEPPFAKHAAITAGVHDGMQAFARAITTTEIDRSLNRPDRRLVTAVPWAAFSFQFD